MYFALSFIIYLLKWQLLKIVLRNSKINHYNNNMLHTEQPCVACQYVCFKKSPPYTHTQRLGYNSKLY